MSPARKKTPRTATYDMDELLERHVRFELERLTGDALAASLGEEAEALHEWLTTLTVGDVLPAATTAESVPRHLADLEVTDGLAGLVADVLVAAHSALAASESRVTDVVSRGDVDALVDVVGDLDGVRSRVIAAVTASSAYQALVARVLYQGIKSYVLTENVLARKIPGASSLVRLGQRGLNTAAPGLEGAVDRQLEAFVKANIGETLKDSRRYLEQHADAAMVRDVADEAWTALGHRTLADLADVVTTDEVVAVSTAAVPLVRALCADQLLASLAGDTLGSVLEQYADHQVAALLTDLGLDRERMVAAIVDLAGPAVERAHESGFLAERLRARLAPFYDSLL